MNRVRIRPSADSDLDEIFAWIARDDVQAADRVVDRLVEAARNLSAFPERGRSRPEIGKGIRSLVVGRYLILYRVSRAHVDVVRIVHGARALEGLFDNMGEE